MFNEYQAQKTLSRSLGRYEKKVNTRILILGDGRGGAASNVIAPGGRGYVWARDNYNVSSKYFPILNLGAVQPAANLLVMVGYDPLSQYPNEEQILGSYTTDTVGIGVRVTHNAATSCAHNAWRLLSFNTERFDSGSMHSTTAKISRLVANAPGTYIANANVLFSACGTGMRLISVRRNANESISGGSGIAIAGQDAISVAGTRTSMNISSVVNLVIGDYIELFAFQDSTATLNVETVDETSPEFSMIRIEQNLV